MFKGIDEGGVGREVEGHSEVELEEHSADR